ncbi:hypothetical protein KIPE111705_06975 [Kibdelosporangium persicum]|uniref:SEC-C motif-containing protein n=1 Tax=Kibdelosporangium persicum TaxID=2698649 RepID=A0ABX2FIA6_9PSEU|nr:hypothetical protein [Kibdelosporangium persicum]NRN70844.1 SEC-C motif-containing protein [Kibdelosporangium persicum]
MAFGDSREPAGKGPRSVPKPKRLAHLRVDNRGYPIIAAIGQAPGDIDFGALSEPRKLALATFDLCAVCALPLGQELRWQVSFDEAAATAKTFISSEAPVHEICALYAAQVCPLVSSPYARHGDEIRKGMKRPKVTFLTGFRRTARVFGQRSGLQTSECVLHFETTGVEQRLKLSTSAEAIEAYQRALEAEVEVTIDDTEREIATRLTELTIQEGEDSGSVMAGAAWFAGGAFCPKVGNVQGMRRFTEDPIYTALARRVLLEPGFAKKFEETDDLYTRAAIKWLNSRDHLPEILASWRKTALNRALSGRSAPDKSSGGVNLKKSKRKLQGAARRKNRR